jgi:hypothetical protein
MVKAAIAVALLAFPGRVSAQTAAAPSDEAGVRAVVNALFDGMRKVDSAVVRPLFHAKARMITVDSRRPGVRIEESVEGFIQQIGRPRTELFDEQLSNVRVMIDGSLASVWADYKFYRGRPFPARERSSELANHRAGRHEANLLDRDLTRLPLVQIQSGICAFNGRGNALATCR